MWCVRVVLFVRIGDSKTLMIHFSAPFFNERLTITRITEDPFSFSLYVCATVCRRLGEGGRLLAFSVFPLVFPVVLWRWKSLPVGFLV
jgi:hypothetical protein